MSDDRTLTAGDVEAIADAVAPKIVVKTMACTGPGAMVEKPANVATSDAVIVASAGDVTQHLTDCIVRAADGPGHGCSAGVLRTRSWAPG